MRRRTIEEEGVSMAPALVIAYAILWAADKQFAAVCMVITLILVTI